LLFAAVPVGHSQKSCSSEQTSQEIDQRIDRISQLQDRAPVIPQLGLKRIQLLERGFARPRAQRIRDSISQAIGLAATWDAALPHEVGDTVSTEAREVRRT
jgi:beta-glucosidase